MYTVVCWRTEDKIILHCFVQILYVLLTHKWLINKNINQVLLYSEGNKEDNLIRNMIQTYGVAILYSQNRLPLVKNIHSKTIQFS